MKITIDTNQRTIELEQGQSVTLELLTKELEKLLPNGEWKKFKLNTQPHFVNVPIYPAPMQPYFNDPNTIQCDWLVRPNIVTYGTETVSV